MKVLPEQLRLYAVTDRTWLGDKTLTQAVEEAIEGGATIVQLRDKNLPDEVILAQAKELSALCKAKGVLFIVNDSVEIALASDADGVHLGLDDGDIAAARAALGEGKIIGASSHNPAEALAAQAAGADYLGCGAVFGSTTKSNATHITPDILRSVTEAVEIPVVAIGGITRENLPTLNGCGLAGAAVVSAIFAQPDIAAASRELYRLTGEL